MTIAAWPCHTQRIHSTYSRHPSASFSGPTLHHPSVGVQLLFAGAEPYLATLRGRNLRSSAGGISFYDRGLLRHRVTWVREASREESRSLADSSCVIERIEIRIVNEEEISRLFGAAGDGG